MHVRLYDMYDLYTCINILFVHVHDSVYMYTCLCTCKGYIEANITVNVSVTIVYNPFSPRIRILLYHVTWKELISDMKNNNNKFGSITCACVHTRHQTVIGRTLWMYKHYLQQTEQQTINIALINTHMYMYLF